MELRTDLAILGAGAAGLAAARVASDAGAAAIVIEARDRIGGRVYTRFESGLDVPVELGAEFVHGMPDVTARLLQAAGERCVPTAGRSFRYENGELREGEDPFDTVARIMTRAAALADDVSIETLVRDVPERERIVVRSMVAGFDAADPRRASARAIAEEWSDQENGQTSGSCRVAGGYVTLLDVLRRALDPQRVDVLLSTPVRAVDYGDDGVVVRAQDVHGTPVTVRARRAVVTLPLGVLQAGTVAFEPPLPQAKRGALGGLIMGPVVRLSLHFRRAFWEELDGGRYRDASFFQVAPGAFQAYWTRAPQRGPLMTAWAGGPNADALADTSDAQRTALALEGLATMFGKRVDTRAELVAVYAHDWQRDPYALGAYSYVAVGANGAREALAAPLAQRLFFAGEAASAASEAGTVAGALQTGEAAARAALASL